MQSSPQWSLLPTFGKVDLSLFPVQLDLPVGMRIKGGNLTTPYKAVQLHLHWGKDGGPGSEHTIDGEQFPMEVRNMGMDVCYKYISHFVFK